MKNESQIFSSGIRRKKISYVKIDEAHIVSDDSYLHVDLGSCVSVILCGIESSRKVWIGANHMFRPRDEDGDVSIRHIAALVEGLQSRGAEQIKCLGLFGGAYREQSPAGKMARTNVMSVLETLSIFNLDINLYQTGFNQGITVMASQDAEMIIMKHRNFSNGNIEFHSFPFDSLFKEEAVSETAKTGHYISY